MAHPKRKISKTRRDKRRTHYKLGTKQLITDPKTGEVSQYHRLNLENGMYKGVQVIEMNEEA
ncbi:MAG: large subunit ribosomal protein L32 [Bacteroidia bacterium]|jgi:large subunit ribosomal protein L32